MVDVIDPDNWIDGLFPSKRQFVTNTIGERLRFGIPIIKKKIKNNIGANNNQKNKKQSGNP